MFDNAYDDERAREVYLKRYLNSQGYELPEDYKEFSLGSAREHECVFCRNPHDNYELIHYSPLKGTKRKVEGSPHICKDCFIFVDTMEEMHFPFLRESPVDSGSPKEYEMEEPAPAHETLERIVAYNADRSFSEDVHKFYLHLDRVLDKYANSFTTCYFCRTFVKAFQRIEVPMGQSPVLNGGYIPCCNFCHEKIAINTNYTYVQRCDRCESHYSITKEEYTSRKHINTIGKHMCSECTHDSQLNMSESSILFIPENHSRWAPMQRFKWQECKQCGTQACLDITISLRHYSYNIYSNGYYCGNCVTAEKHIGKDNESVQFNERISILMKHENDYWTYVIYELVNGKRKDIYRSADQISKDDLQCLFIALEECTKLFTKEQLEIWPEVDLQDP